VCRPKGWRPATAAIVRNVWTPGDDMCRFVTTRFPDRVSASTSNVKHHWPRH
jgi:hypothetical protein